MDLSDSDFMAAISEFLKKGGYPNKCDQFKDTLLHLAAKKDGRCAAVEELIAKGADVNMANFLGQTPLHVAVRHKNRKVVKCLLSSKSVHVNLKDCPGNTALHYAINSCMGFFSEGYCHHKTDCPHREFDPDIFSMLMGHPGIFLNATNTMGYTPLSWAIVTGQRDVAMLLLSKGASVRIGDAFHTPLKYAVKRPYPNVPRILEKLQRGDRMPRCYDVNILYKFLVDEENYYKTRNGLKN